MKTLLTNLTAVLLAATGRVEAQLATGTRLAEAIGQLSALKEINLFRLYQCEALPDLSALLGLKVTGLNEGWSRGGGIAELWEKGGRRALNMLTGEGASRRCAQLRETRTPKAQTHADRK